jgi:hypothetical protein
MVGCGRVALPGAAQVGVLTFDGLGVGLGIDTPLSFPSGVEGIRRFDTFAPGGWNTLGGVGGGGAG